MDPLVHELVSAGLAPSTLRSYRSGVGKYTKFCEEEKLTPFSAMEEVVCSFVASLFRAGIAGTSVKGYLAAHWDEKSRAGAKRDRRTGTKGEWYGSSMPVLLWVPADEGGSYPITKEL